MGSLRVGHNWATSLSLFTFMHWKRKWQPTPVFLPGDPRDGGAWWAAVCGVAQSRTRLKWLSSNHVNKLHKVHTINSYIQDYLNIYNTQDTLSIRSIKMRVKRTMSQSCSVCFWGCPGRGPRRGMLKGSGSPATADPRGYALSVL